MPAATHSNRRLTDSQRSVHNALCDYIDQNNGLPPSIMDICRKTDLAFSTVNHSLAALEKKQYLKRRPGVARGLIVLRRLGEQSAASGLKRDGRALKKSRA